MECEQCGKSLTARKNVATIECLSCCAVMKNPIFHENLYKNGQPRKRDAHEDASDRDVKTDKAWRDWQERRR